MLRRLLAVVAGVAPGALLVLGLDRLVALRFALAIGVGVGTGIFLVADGSAGAGEGWVYHRVRTRASKLLDAAFSVGAGVLGGLVVAGLSVAVQLGELGAGVLVVTAALLGANVAFVYRRPDYEDHLED